MSHSGSMAERVEAKQPQPRQVSLSNGGRRIGEANEVNFLSRLLTGSQAKEIVIFGEDNFTFDIALATARDNSWNGISYGVRHVLRFQEKKLKSIELCSKMGRQQRLSEIDIMSRFQDMLKTPAPPSGVKGKVVWYQYPWTKGGPAIQEVTEEMKDQQQKGDYLLFGRLSKDCDYTFSHKDTFDRSCPNYSFLGVDKRFVNKLVSYGYCNQGSSDSEHLTFVLQKK